MKNDLPLEVPSGVEGIVIDTQKFSRRMSLSEEERKAFEVALKEAEAEGSERIALAFGAMIGNIEELLKKKLTDEDGNPLVEGRDHRKRAAEQAHNFNIESLDVRKSRSARRPWRSLYKQERPAVEAAIDARDRKLNSMKPRRRTRAAAVCYRWSRFTSPPSG